MSIVVRLLNFKFDWNIAEGKINSMKDLIKELVDRTLEVPDSYYNTKNMVSKLGLSQLTFIIVKMIVCYTFRGMLNKSLVSFIKILAMSVLVEEIKLLS